ncbi:MAG TPA: protein translocase subunit SecD [Kofleriaceae bacterium]|nr:protein translocase subunit SecD [Kofleriaceae bacterium]
MDRSLKWRTLGLIGLVVLCVCILLPSVTDDEDLPSWFPFEKSIKLGLDLKGGLHIVYSIDLNTAIVDRASEIERDLKSRFADEKVNATVRAPRFPLGALTVAAPDAAKKEEITKLVQQEYGDTIEMRDCEADAGANAVCFKVSNAYAERIKKSALENAVSTIRDRIDEKGVAEPSVVQKDEEIIVELPGLSKADTAATRDLIARAAKLEFKVVDDGAQPGQKGSAGSQYMNELFGHVGHLRKEDVVEEGQKVGDPTDPLAKEMRIYAEVDRWRPEESGQDHIDFYLKAYDRTEAIDVDWAKRIGCLKKNDKAKEKEIKDGKISCAVKGWQAIEEYLRRTIEAQEKATPDKPSSFRVPDDHQISFEWIEPETGKDRTPYWRSYYLYRAVRLTGTAIVKAVGSFEPNTNRPVVLLDFNRYGSRVFGDLTAQIVGQKLATILDNKVKSAPIINTAIRGGRASITLGGGDANRQIRDRDELVNVLNTGSLPAPLREESSSEVGPTLGRDAIQKTKVSFGLGIALVVLIMVGVYRWSGWISVFAVIFHNVITLAVMAVFGATLTLPGIAAIVLSVGMTVDGNILIYERIRDELLLGKSVRGAVDLGFSRAFSAILDGQLTTAAAGWVLLQYGSGPIKGFATLLLVGVFTTIVTNTWITRIFFDWYISRKKGQLATISI